MSRSDGAHTDCRTHHPTPPSCCTAARTAERCPISQSLHPGVEYTVTLEKA